MRPSPRCSWTALWQKPTEQVDEFALMVGQWCFNDLTEIQPIVDGYCFDNLCEQFGQSVHSDIEKGRLVICKSVFCGLKK